MKRQEVLSLLERYPEFFDGDDELLHELITDSRPEASERDAARSEPIAATLWKTESDDRSAKQPR
jgi:hypothetical protein